MKPTRKKLRNNSTKPEQVLWNSLKCKQFHGLKFRRQHSFGRYVVDFYCNEKTLAIEVDGDNHFEKNQMEYDQIRTDFLNSVGVKVIRYTNTDVIENIDGVLIDLEKRLGFKS